GPAPADSAELHRLEWRLLSSSGSSTSGALATSLCPAGNLYKNENKKYCIRKGFYLIGDLSSILLRALYNAAWLNLVWSRTSPTAPFFCLARVRASSKISAVVNSRAPVRSVLGL